MSKSAWDNHFRPKELLQLAVTRAEAILGCAVDPFSVDGSGVYCLFTENGDVYVGSSQNIRKRRNGHLVYLRKGVHHNSQIQRVFDKHGQDYFWLFVIETCSKALLEDCEQRWLDLAFSCGARCLNSFRAAYRVSGKDHPMYGRTHTEQAKAKIREARSKQTIKHSAATKRKIGKGNRGKSLSEEARAKISATKTGVKNPKLGVMTPAKLKVCEDRKVHRDVPNLLGLYRSGMSINGIAKELDCSWDVVKRILVENNEPLRTHSEQKRLTDLAKKNGES